MSPKERHYQEPHGERAPLAQIVFDVPGLSPDHFDRKGRIKDRAMRNKFISSLLHSEKGNASKPPQVNWDHVIDNVNSGKHKGNFIVTSGAIIVTIGAVGVEIGRHGKDIKSLLRLIKWQKNNT